MENAMNLLSVHDALSEFINIAWIFAFSDKLSKRTNRAKRVHLLGKNIHLPEEIHVAKLCVIIFSYFLTLFVTILITD